MTNEAEMLKFAICGILEKQGMQMDEFEEMLEKKALVGDMLGNADKGMSGLWKLMKAYGSISAVVGAGGGIGLYHAANQISDSGNKIEEQERKVQKTKDATRELQAIRAQQLGLI